MDADIREPNYVRLRERDTSVYRIVPDVQRNWDSQASQLAAKRGTEAQTLLRVYRYEKSVVAAPARSGANPFESQ